MTNTDRLYFIEPQPEYSPHIGALVQMMAYARMTTLKAVAGVSMAELDATVPGFSNSVGMLLAHIAATDRIYQAASFENRDPFETPEYAPYIGAMTFGWKGEKVQGHTLESLLAELEEFLRRLKVGSSPCFIAIYAGKVARSRRSSRPSRALSTKAVSTAMAFPRCRPAL